MIAAAGWMLVALGMAHVACGLVWFRQPLAEALREGLIGKFGGIAARRLAFWFIVFGPLIVMAGHVTLHAAANSDTGLLRIAGFYLLGISLAGVLALPRSPFWIALILSPILIAGGAGWIA